VVCWREPERLLGRVVIFNSTKESFGQAKVRILCTQPKWGKGPSIIWGGGAFKRKKKRLQKKTFLTGHRPGQNLAEAVALVEKVHDIPELSDE